MNAVAPAPPTAAQTVVTRRDVDLVYASALRRCGGDAHLAEDVTQATFLLFARHRNRALRSAEKTGSLAAWLLATARFVAANARRRQRRRHYHEGRAALHAPSRDAVASPDPSVALCWGELAPLLDDAVLALPAGDRAAILLRYYEDRSSSEIAAALGCSPVAARQRVSRALVKLRKMLSRRGLELPAATLSAAMASQAVSAAPVALAQSCLSLAAGGVAASAAAASLATGASMFAPVALKTAALALAAAAVVTAVGLGGGGSTTAPAATSRAATIPTTAPAAAPATYPLADAAAIDAANLLPSDRVHERTLVASDADKERIDLDTGRTYGREDWMQASDQTVDAVISRDPLTPGVRGLALVVRPVAVAAWDLKVAAPEVGELWKRRPAYGEGEYLDALGDLPRTYLFRTEEGAGGVLQILARINGKDGEPDGIKLRYKVLVRGEGRTAVEQAESMTRPARTFPGETGARQRLGGSIRAALQAMQQYGLDQGDDQFPPDLATVEKLAGGDWPKDLPETLVYVRPTYDPASPRARGLPVLFEQTALPPATADDPAPGVVVGFEDGSTRVITDAAELAKLLRAAGLASTRRAAGER